MREQLLEIKKGNTGTGLLLERDGYASLDMPENKVLKESIESFKNGDANELPRPFVVSAVFQKYGIENANGRIYPEDVLKREVEKYINGPVKERRAVGECEHADSASLNSERICLLITELHWVGHTLVGKMEIPISEGFRRHGICSTLADRIAQWLISGIKLGVSSRALGSVTQEGGHLLVGNDLEILSWDVVVSPSTPSAYIEFEEEKLQPYIQENIKCNDKNNELISEDKYSKFEKWLKD